MTKTRIAINGFGRIGRAFFRAAWGRDELEIASINDLGDIHNIAYLLKYDSVYGPAPFSVEVREGDNAALIVGGREVRFISERDPQNLPWNEEKIDIVVESTGVFTSYEKSKAHLLAGAKRVVITAPVKDEPSADIKGITVLMGINDNLLADCQISSNASCTTNSASPVVQILHEEIGIKKAVLNTVHAYTASQAIVDAPDAKDFRRGRAAAANIIPASTGAAVAVTMAITELKDKFDGIALRVPVIAGSIADITFIADRATSVEEINRILKNAAGEDRWRRIFAVTEEPIVSSDILGSKFASIADLSMTRVVDGDLVKVLAWYDNEMGYVNALIEHVAASGRYTQ
jgi:glyceraldehyde 3-phosphate dehydrogenase